MRVVPTRAPWVALVCTWAVLVASTLFISTGLISAPAAAATIPIKSPNDHNRYRIIELSNGLQALLISNPHTDMAAAAMDVATGSGDDPTDRPGLAHFCEHMLFLGTRKYPKADSYQTFISNHGGSHNAMTMFQHTNYFFDITPDALAPALDRFAQQFTAPLFNAKYVSREKHAVASEYQAKRKLDSLRYYSAYRQALNPAHPLSHFSVGNLKTLADHPGDPVRKDLIHFYRTHYSANIMKLVVYGKQPLDQLEKMVRARFSAIPNRHLTPTAYPMPIFRPGSLPALLRVQSIKDRRDLSLDFPIPSTRADYPVKPVYYLANLLGHEGKGSLTDILKQAGLAQALAAGKGQDTGDGATLNLDISLTKAGYEHWHEVVALTFDYIDRIRMGGIKSIYHEENRRLAQIAFRYHEQSQPIQLVSALAQRLQEVKPRDVLQAPYLLTRYAPDEYRRLLDHLTPDNVLISLMSPQPLKGKVKKTTWYDTPYQLSAFSLKATLDAQRNNPLAARLALPTPNPFIPDKLALLPGKTMNRPEHLEKGPISVWYARNTAFGTPKADVYINFRSPTANRSPKDYDLAQILTQTIADQLDSFSYPAELAGLDYDIYPHLRGITVRVGGYDEKLHVLLEKVLQALMQPNFDPQQFRIHKQQLLDSLSNARNNMPYQQALDRTQELLLSNLWDEQSRLKAAHALTLQDLEHFSRQFGKALEPVMLVDGNLSRASALGLASMVNALALNHARAVEVPRSRVHALPTDTSLHFRWPVNHPDTGYVRYIQGTSTQYRERASFMLLGQILSSPFYDSLRTRQQLGYVVFASDFPMLDVPGLGLVVESPKLGPKQLDQKVSEFLKQYEGRLKGMSEQTFRQHKRSVIAQLKEKPKQLRGLSQRYWNDIDRANFRFDSRERLIAAIRALKKQDIVQLYQTQIAQEHRSLLVTTSKDADTRGNAAVRRLIREQVYVQ